ncbi:hypothetical protein V2W45_1344637 [Cenococcum geophilum]
MRTISEWEKEFRRATEKHDVAALKALGPAKPFLVVVPLALVKQWIEELQRFSPIFDIQVYHNKSSTQKSATADVLRWNVIFTQKHELFNGDLANARVVVISTYGTIASHHSPNALKKWRERIYKTTEAKESVRQPDDWFEQPDRKWPRDLSGRWHSILLDEAHHVRNSDSLAHIAIGFMDCPFTVLYSAAPLFRRSQHGKRRHHAAVCNGL